VLEKVSANNEIHKIRRVVPLNLLKHRTKNYADFDFEPFLKVRRPKENFSPTIKNCSTSESFPQNLWVQLTG